MTEKQKRRILNSTKQCETNGMKDKVKLKNYYSAKEFLENYIYDGNDLGAECKEEGTTFRLWSPQAECVSLRLGNLE